MKKFYQKQRLVAAISAITLMLLMFTSSLWASSGITGTTPSTRCNAGSVVLHATSASGTIKWYDVPFYGTAFPTGASAKGTVSGDGTTFTTASISKTTTYYVDAVDANGCSLNTGNARVPIIATVTSGSISANIFYASQVYCNSLNTLQTVTRTGSAGGVFSVAPDGLTVDSGTGAFNPNGTAANSYTITYHITTPALGCVEMDAITNIIISNASAAPVISYSGSPWCTSTGAKSVNITNPGVGGTFSATPTGLAIDVSTGTIDPAASGTGVYDVAYFVPGGGGCEPQQAHTSVTILELPTASISYASPFCNDAVSQEVVLTGTGVYTGGTFTKTAGAGTLSINASTGAINPGASTAGTYTVSYTLAAVSPCGQVVATTSVTINPRPTAVISGTTALCLGNSTNLSIALTGTSPWSFTYTDGATPVTVTDQVANTATLSVSPFGTKTYTLTSVNDALCNGTISGSATVTVSNAPLATFEYSGSPYCSNGTDPSPNMLGEGTKGTFSSTAGLVFVDAATGVIDLSASTAGTYEVTNTIAATGGCSVITATSNVTITKLPVATFTYAKAAYCTNEANPSPTKTDVTTSGLFTGTSGLFFTSASTGEINLAVCTPGNHTVTYTVDVANGCSPISETFNIVIKAIPSANAGFSKGICVGASTTLGAAQVGENTYSWTSVPAGFTSTLPNPTVSPAVATTYTLVESNGSCTNTHSVTISILPLPAANAIIGTGTLCAGSTGETYTSTNDYSATGAIYIWDYTGTGATWSVNSPTSISVNFSDTATSGNLTLTEIISGCSNINTKAITVNPLPDAAIAGTTTVCQNSAAPNVTFTGSLGTAPYTFTYKINGGADLTAVSTGNTATVAAPTTTAGVFTYTLTSVQDASSTSCSKTVTGSATITVDQQVPTAAAGSDQANCNNGIFTLAGNAASVGQGTWTVTSGTATITSLHSETSGVTGVIAGTPAVLRWTIVNGTCSSYDEVTLTNDIAPTAAAAGSDQAHCNNGSFTLAGNAASVGQGTWTVTSGTATITSLHSATSGVTGVTAGTSAVLRWTIVNGTCSSYDEVNLVNNALPTITLGTNPDVTIGTTSGNLPFSATTETPDKYSIVFDATAKTAGFADVTDAVLGATPIVIAIPAVLTGLQGGLFNATLTVKNATTGCVSSSSAITITVHPAAPTGNATQSFCSGS